MSNSTVRDSISSDCAQPLAVAKNSSTGNADGGLGSGKGGGEGIHDSDSFTCKRWSEKGRKM